MTIGLDIFPEEAKLNFSVSCYLFLFLNGRVSFFLTNVISRNIVGW